MPNQHRRLRSVALQERRRVRRWRRQFHLQLQRNRVRIARRNSIVASAIVFVFFFFLSNYESSFHCEWISDWFQPFEILILVLAPRMEIDYRYIMYYERSTWTFRAKTGGVATQKLMDDWKLIYQLIRDGLIFPKPLGVLETVPIRRRMKSFRYYCQSVWDRRHFHKLNKSAVRSNDKWLVIRFLVP